MFLLPLLLLACVPASPEPASCAGLAPDECDDYANCATVEAVAPGAGAAEAVGCAYAEDPDDLACPPQELCVHDPADPSTCYRSPSGCIPDGWEQGCEDGEDACLE
ncbi:MAG: hypothetical protein ABIO70_04005 [Pseudomonadota bacterium]